MNEINDKKQYDSFAHAKYHIQYHFIFSTKFRRGFLNGMRTDVLDGFRHASKGARFKILVMEIDRDHVHLLVKARPSISPEQIVRRLKMFSISHLYRLHEAELNKIYWKNKKGHRKLWTNGYFCSTIGEAGEETIKKYIQNQGKVK